MYSERDAILPLGLTPRQNSSGGKPTLGAITKAGNRYIRKLLVLAATSLPHAVGKRKGALRDWIVALLARKPARLVTVALANKLARIVFAMIFCDDEERRKLPRRNVRESVRCRSLASQRHGGRARERHAPALLHSLRARPQETFNEILQV